MPTETIVRYLDYYTRPDTNADPVLIGVTDLGTPPLTGVITGSDAALTTRATAEGKSAWDEATICAEYSLTAKPAPEVASA